MIASSGYLMPETGKTIKRLSFPSTIVKVLSTSMTQTPANVCVLIKRVNEAKQYPNGLLITLKIINFKVMRAVQMGKISHADTLFLAVSSRGGQSFRCSC